MVAVCPTTLTAWYRSGSSSATAYWRPSNVVVVGRHSPSCCPKRPGQYGSVRASGRVSRLWIPGFSGTMCTSS